MFLLEYYNQPRKFLKKLDKHILKRLIEELENLQQNPFPQDVVRVQGEEEKTFRVRRGDYRIQYGINYENNTLFIYKIEKRSKAYKE